MFIIQKSKVVLANLNKFRTKTKDISILSSPWVDGLSQKNEVGQDCLGKEDGRNAEVKLPFLSFMTKEVHARQSADAAAYNGHQMRVASGMRHFSLRAFHLSIPKVRKVMILMAMRYMKNVRMIILVLLRKAGIYLPRRILLRPCRCLQSH